MDVYLDNKMPGGNCNLQVKIENKIEILYLFY